MSIPARRLDSLLLAMPEKHPTPRQLLDRLVAFDTTSRNSNLELLGWVADYLEGHGIASTLIHDATAAKANLFATVGPDADGGIVLSGHSDVVPVDGQDWASDPWRVVERDGRLYGRGTADMKSFIAVVLAFVPRLLERPLSAPIHLALTYDEEVGCLGVRSLIDYFAKNGPRPRAIIVGEPTEMAVVNANKTTVLLRTALAGAEAHTASPHHGVNAIMHAARLIAWLDELARELERDARDARFDPPYSTVSVNVVEGGTAGNIVPNECAFLWDMRLLPGTKSDPLIERFERFVSTKVLPEMRARSKKAGIATERLAFVPGLVPEQGSAAETLAMALTESNRTAAVSYATEAGLYQGLHVPTVICGPGCIDQAHKPDEFIELSQLDACARFMERLLDHLGAKRPAKIPAA